MINFTVSQKQTTAGYGLFVIEPLEQGYGHTLGTSLRRILLTSLPGIAITQVKIEKVRHPFSTLPGLKEDIVTLLMNLKKVRLTAAGQGPFKLTLEKSGPGVVKAGDIKFPATVKIVNPDLVLGTLSDKKSKISAQMQAEEGTGYSPSEERKTGVVGMLALDAIFSPVTRVNYRVEATRVGRLTNYDRLILEVWTDGTTEPTLALKKASQILIDYANQIISPKLQEEEVAAVSVSAPARDQSVLSLSVEELNIPARIANALMRGGYETVVDLVEANREDLLKIRNLGDKSLKIISAALGEHGITFPKS